MLGQKTMSTKRKQRGSDSPQSAESARLDDNESVATRIIGGKRLQTQAKDNCEPEKIPLGELPLEVWWNVIDALEDDQNALVACALVCRGWAPRIKRLLGRPITFRWPRDVREIAKLGRTDSQEVKSCRRVEIMRPDSLRTLGLFAVMFGGKMRRLKTLLVRGTKWKPGETHADVFLHLSAFTSITWLTLRNVIFPSAQTFGHLVSALPSLTTLRCQYVLFETHALRAGAFLRRPRNLAALDLCVWDLATMHDVSQFLIATEMASTLKEIIIRWPIKLVDLEKSGIPALVSSVGASLNSLCLTIVVDPLPNGERVSAFDFGKLVNLKCFDISIDDGPYYQNEDILPLIVPWICDCLEGLPEPLAPLRHFTLRLPLDTRSSTSPQDSPFRHRSHVQHCKLLDYSLSTPSFMGLELFILEIQTFRLMATDKAELQRLAPTRFPNLAARGVFRVVVNDNLPDPDEIARKRDEDGYAIADVELL